MSERDELLKVMLDADEAHAPEGSMWPELAAAILAAGYRKPRIITTIEELKTVYEGAILHDCHGDIWGIDGKSGRLFSIHDGADELYDDDELDLPATVVYEEQP